MNGIALKLKTNQLVKTLSVGPKKNPNQTHFLQLTVQRDISKLPVVQFSLMLSASNGAFFTYLYSSSECALQRLPLTNITILKAFFSLLCLAASLNDPDGLFSVTP